ncbi:immunity protein 7-domain-containing protein [Penicillium cataractarum]|uniref:Immunity protein 7-domain-containing protein n=1 Tax=Penicillium cataractarum TaxID=2100454 RepID=A0A9W9SH60_9EURO|nr:immunity protein 7-domain-containing protein [Penicillium cataractarum]KAJ5377579.1 immunity protein 7-domain-containing protein [Penicillium cataractarum]
MRITAQDAGGIADEDDQVLEAGFSQGPGDSNLSMIFQRDLFEEEPWKGDPQSTDYFSDSYCITLGTGETVYGGLEQVSFSGTQGTFDFSGRAAKILGIGRQLVVDFKVSEQDLRLFQEFLRKVVTWGVPSQVPQLHGFTSSTCERQQCQGFFI